MNIELRRRTDPILSRRLPGNNDNLGERLPARPRRRVIIHKPAKSAMTSGRARVKQWLLEFEPQSAPFIEPLMGWTGSTDPLAHMQLTFGSREAAIVYAERHGLDYEVPEPERRRTDRGSTTIRTSATHRFCHARASRRYQPSDHPAIGATPQPGGGAMGVSGGADRQFLFAALRATGLECRVSEGK